MKPAGSLCIVNDHSRILSFKLEPIKLLVSGSKCSLGIRTPQSNTSSVASIMNELAEHSDVGVSAAKDTDIKDVAISKVCDVFFICVSLDTCEIIIGHVEIFSSAIKNIS